ncbi:3-hydroxyacyl-CoA dehydrogenase family protein [Alteromonas sp. BL110]|uniref:3-hydroxyacyl-CoA dehydrogenase family protein n=1 Tax=Alteromonas sp. BL110 TaxID=1714845 RepID=UPI000E4D1C2A|nr:3-hydroxyacyl-CoA dehydrogenase NAD-binding domain-containing protein [Alteromonas sp. BL110]AXT39270.1 3-hydroxyacyl-CoA dehydrogenase family protein [Alteromonas sp. BL110]RKM82246.1 3-hydroxyacyl-CoA dehydrogenase family protein [Alteromonas sp. BL110]
MFETSKVAVIGAGLMGCGIAQVFASHSISVCLYDPIEKARDAALSKIASNLESVGQSEVAINHIKVMGNLAKAVESADFIIEAIPEKLNLKRDFFQQLPSLVKPTAIVCSNTSVIPIREIFDDIALDGRVVGTHWWNPPYLVPLVEVVESEKSSDEAVRRMIDLLHFVGKKPVHVKKDVPGFVGNRMQHALWREAIALINDGVCSAEDIDIVVKNSFGLRLPQLGPIENADLIGLDLTLDIHNVILESLNKDSHPSSILVQKVNSNSLGAKTGNGFLSWNEESVKRVREDLNNYLLKVTESESGK